jgi:hypothetical protein
MSKTTMMKLMAAGFLLVAVFTGVAGAQTRSTESACYINTGLFTVARGEGVNFHVALDDRRSGAPATVLLRLFNRDGAVVAREDVTLRPGQATSLQVHEPGLYRAQVRLLERPLSARERRTVFLTAEIFQAISPASRRPEDREDSTGPVLRALHGDSRTGCIPE